METWRKCYIDNKRKRLQNNLDYLKSFILFPEDNEYKQKILEIEIELKQLDIYESKF